MLGCPSSNHGMRSAAYADDVIKGQVGLAGNLQKLIDHTKCLNNHHDIWWLKSIVSVHFS